MTPTKKRTLLFLLPITALITIVSSFFSHSLVWQLIGLPLVLMLIGLVGAWFERSIQPKVVAIYQLTNSSHNKTALAITGEPEVNQLSDKNSMKTFGSSYTHIL